MYIVTNSVGSYQPLVGLGLLQSTLLTPTAMHHLNASWCVGVLALAQLWTFSDATFTCTSAIEDSTDYSVPGIKFMNVSTINDCCFEVSWQ